jgi:L-threonylcarbamoyladenylate synthase
MYLGIRVPSHPLALQLLRVTDLPIAAPSANRFAHVSPTRAHHVLADLGMKGVRVLNGDTEDVSNDDNSHITCKHGIESTVLRVNWPERALQIFRQGAVTKDDVEQLLQEHGITNDVWKVEVVSRVVKMHAAPTSSSVVPSVIPPVSTDDEVLAPAATDSGNTVGEIAPGQAVTHYSPDIPCFIVSALKSSAQLSQSDDDHPIINLDEITASQLAKESSNEYLRFPHNSVLHSQKATLAENGVVLLDFNGQLEYLRPFALEYRDLSSSGSSVEGARNLFDYLRWAECIPQARMVLVARLSMDGSKNSKDSHSSESDNKLALGLSDRMFRAASGVEVVLSVE